MGLDIYHLKAVSEPVDPYDHIFWDDFLPYMDPENRFESYLRDDIPDFEVIHFIHLYSDLGEFEHWSHGAAKRGVIDWEDRYLLGDPTSCRDQINRIAVKRGFAPDVEYNPGYIDYPDGTYRGVGERFVGWYRRTRRTGFFYVRAGYQRRGMDEHFKKDYEDGGLYTKFSRFLALPRYLDEEWRTENVSKNFIGNYEQGRSVLRVMY